MLSDYLLREVAERLLRNLLTLEYSALSWSFWWTARHSRAEQSGQFSWDHQSFSVLSLIMHCELIVILNAHIALPVIFIVNQENGPDLVDEGNKFDLFSCFQTILFYQVLRKSGKHQKQREAPISPTRTH